MSLSPLTPFGIMRIASFSGALLLTLFACSTPETEDLPWAFENEEPAWITPEDAWQLGPAPVVVVGELEHPDDPGGVEDALFGVRGGGLFPDGGFALAERGGNRIMLYGNDGRMLATLGGEGSGPGEFQELMFLATSATAFEMAAWDPALQRSTLFRRDPSLETLSNLSPEGRTGEEGRWASQVVPGPLPGEDGLPVPVTFLDPHHLVAYLGPPEVRDGEREVLGLAVYRLASGGTYERVTEGWEVESKFCGGSLEGRGCQPAPLTTFQAVAGRGALVVASHPQHFAFLAHELGSTASWPERIHGRPLSSRRVTDSLVDSLARWEAGPNSTPAQVAEKAREIRAMGLPPKIQGIDALVVDPEGVTWARKFGGDVWYLFTSEGRWLGTLELPSGFTLLDVSTDRILGHRRGALGVERVEVWELCREACSSEAPEPEP